MTAARSAGVGPFETFGDVLVRRRMEKGWTVSELSRRTGITRQAIYRYEEDERTPTLPYRICLRTILGLSKSDDHGWWSDTWDE